MSGETLITCKKCIELQVLLFLVEVYKCAKNIGNISGGKNTEVKRYLCVVNLLTVVFLCHFSSDKK